MEGGCDGGREVWDGGAKLFILRRRRMKRICREDYSVNNASLKSPQTLESRGITRS